MFMKWRQNNDQRRQQHDKRKQQQQQQQQYLQQQQMHQLQLQGRYVMPLHNNSVNNNNQQPVRDVNSSNGNIFLSRIMPNVGIDTIRKYLQSIGASVINIQKVSHNSAKFNSFKVCVKNSDYSKVSNQLVWSLCGAKCRPWNESGNNMHNNYNSVNNDVSINNDLWDNMSHNRYHY